MAISINSKGYNIGEISVSTKLEAGASVTIGNAKDLEAIRGFAETGIMRIKATIDMGDLDAEFDGCVVCNICPNGFEFHTITYFDSSVTGGSPIIVGGQLYMDGTALKCHITAVTVS